MDNKQGQPENRRRFTRVPLSLEVNIKFDNLSSFVSEYSSDLSVGGIFIKTSKPRKVGTSVNLTIVLMNGERLIEATGRVVRVVLPGDRYTGAVPGMAIEFTDISPQSRKTIEECIEMGEGDENRP